MKKTALLLTILVIIASFCACDSTDGNDITDNDPDYIIAPDTAYTEPQPTDPPLDEPVQKAQTYSGNVLPQVVDNRQYLPTEPVDRAEEGKIVYTTNSTAAGYIEGTTVQNANEATTTVRAVANLGYEFVGWSDGYAEDARTGDTAEGVYTAIFDYAILDMPIISVNTVGARPIMSQEEYLDSTISIIGCNEEYELDAVDSLIRGRGNASWGHPKKSYKFKLDKKENLFGLANGKERIWVLIANYSDITLLRNHISLELARAMEGIAWNPASISVELFVNGEYRGVYLLAEEIKISGDRVNIIDTMPDEIDTGYLVELSDYVTKPDGLPAARRGYAIHTDLSSDPEIHAAQRQFIKDYLNSSYQALYEGDLDEVSKYIDVDSLAAAYLVEEIVKNVDNQYDSFYMHKDRGDIMHFGPVWDFDHSIGYRIKTAEFPEGIYVGNGEGSSGRIQDWFPCAMRSKWFRELVQEKWNAMYDKLLTLPDYAVFIAESGLRSYGRNFEKWNMLDVNAENYSEQYYFISDWLTKRVEWLNVQFNSEEFIEKGEGLRYYSYYKHLMPPEPEEDEDY